MFTSWFELIYFIAVSWTCLSGSALNTRFKHCFRISTATSVLYGNRAASSTGWRRWNVGADMYVAFYTDYRTGVGYLAYGVRPVYRNGAASCKSTYGYLAATRWFVHHIFKQPLGLLYTMKWQHALDNYAISMLSYGRFLDTI